MALQSKVGSFLTETATGNKAYTGVGFTPKVVLFFANGRGSDGTDSGASGQAQSINIGAGISSTSRFAIGTGNDNTGTNYSTNQDNTKCLIVENWAANAARIAADLVSLDSDGFTLNYTTVNATAVVINYIALGGADLTNVAIKQFTGATDTTGNHPITGVGFKPDAILLFGVFDLTTPPHIATAVYGLNMGWGVSATQRGTSSVRASVADTRYQSAAQVYAIATGSTQTTPFRAGDLVSMDTDGFTINWTTISSDADVIWALCLKGGQYRAGSFNQATSTGNQANTGPGFTPVGLLLATFAAVTNSSVITTESDLGIGAASSTTARGAVFWSNGTDQLERLSRIKIVTIEPEAGTPSVVAEADLASFDATGFTLNWTTVDATAREILYLALGSAAAAGPSVTDAVSVAEAITIAVSAAQASSSSAITVAEAPIALLVDLASASETITAAESVTSMLIDLASVSEAIALAEATTQAVSDAQVSSVNEAITVSEAVTVAIPAPGATLSVSVAEAITLAETVTPNLVCLASVSEAITVGEVPIVGRYHTFGAGDRIPTAANTMSNANPLTQAFTCQAGSTVLVLALVYAGSADRTGGAPTYNSIALTQADTAHRGTTSPECSCELWYLLAPPTGSSLTISIPNAGALNMFAAVGTALAGTGSASRLDVANGTNAATSTNPTLSQTTTVNGDILFAVVANGANAWAPSAQTGTVIDNGDPSTWGGGTQYLLQSTAGSQTMAWTFGTSEDWGEIIASFELVPAPSVSDSITITDAPTVTVQGAGPQINVSDAIALAESTGQVISDAAANVSSAITLAEATTITLIDLASVTDSVAVAEAASVTLIDLISVSSAITLAEVPGTSVSDSQVNVSETITVAEAPTVAVPAGPQASDAIAVSEGIGATISTAAASVTSAIAVAEVVTVALGSVAFQISVSDAIALDETLGPAGAAPDVDAITVSESVAIALAGITLQSSVSSAITLAEAVSATVDDPQASATSAITASEAASALLVSLVNASSAITVTETTAETLVSPASASESVSVGDAPSVLLESQVSAGETLTLTESVAPLLVSLASVTSSITLAEAVAASTSAPVVSVADAVSLSEATNVTIVISGTNQVSVSDAIAVAESVVAQVGALTLSVTDVIAAGEAVSVTVVAPGAFAINAGETITATESITVTSSTPAVSLAESITATETMALAMSDAAASVASAVTIGESVSVSLVAIGTLIISVSDAATVADAPTVAPAPLAASASDAATVADSATITLVAIGTLQVSVMDTATLTDMPALLMAPAGVSVAESISVADASVVSFYVLPTHFVTLALGARSHTLALNARSFTLDKETR